MNILREIQKYFMFHKDALSPEEDLLLSARLYSFLGLIFTPINLIATLDFQNEYNIIVNIIIAILFLFILVGSYKFKALEKNIHSNLFILFTAISLYTIINAFYKGMPYNEIFAVVILLFVFGIVIENIKNLIVYFTITAISLIIVVLKSEVETIDKSYLFSFLSIFLIINFVVNRSKAKNKNKLVSREKFLKTLFNETADGFMLVNVYTKEIIDCNKRLLILLELETKSEIVGYKNDKFNKIKYTQEDFKKLQYQLKNKRVYRKKSVFISKKGKEFVADIVYSIVNIENNDFYFVRITDISESLENEKKVLKSENKYKTLFDNNVAGVFRTKLTGSFIEINHAFAETFGYTKSELIKKNSSCLYFNDDDRKAYIDQLLTKNKLYNKTLRVRKKSGEEVWVLINVALRIDEDEKFMEGTLIDVTDIKHINEKISESEERFKRLSEASYEGIVIHQKGKILDANETFCKLSGYSRAELKNIDGFNLAIGKTKTDIIEKMKSRDTKPFEGKMITKEGKTVEVSIRGREIPFKGELSTVTSIRDISFEKGAAKKIQEEQLRVRVAEESNKLLSNEIHEREQIQQELRKTQKFLTNIINSSLDIIISTDKEGNITNFNKAAENSFGYKANEVLGKSSSILYFDKGEENQIRKSLNNKEGKFFGEIVNKTKSGDTFISFISASKLKDETGSPIGSMGVSRDITNIKAGEEELRISEERYRDLFENATDMIQSVDAEGKIMFVNKAWKDILGYKKDSEVVGKNISDFLHPDGLAYSKSVFNSLKKGNIEIQFITKNKHKIITEGTINTKKEGKVVIATRGLFRDITERIEQEKEIKRGLEEKEILLAEIHHRVKNNLQVISSILNLQSSYVTDQGTLDILKESQNRVKSMSFIHESLYQTKDFSSIRFSDYIKNLSSNLLYSYQVYDNLVELKTELDEIQIDLDQSIPAGLIINELVTNALKYGFPNEREGLIEIKLREENDFITIIVRDDGVGMTKDINFENTESLGLQLVHTLSEQLDADLSYKSVKNKGVEFKIKFKKI